MNFHAPARALACLLLLPADFCAQAQTASRPAARDPLDAAAAVPALSYRSPFLDYRSLRDEKPVPWRQANDAVRDIGGWRVYAREAQASAPAAAASAPQP